MKELHVAIIGAGLGGLCLAQGLARSGIPFDVYEADASPASRTQGYRIRIDAAGQEALSRCLPPHLLTLFRQSCAAQSRGGRFVGPSLEATPGRSPGSWRDTATEERGDAPVGDLCAHRQTLREILLCGLDSRVHFGAGFVDFAQHQDGRLVVSLADGSTIATDLLVAADGVNSAVARRLAPDLAPEDIGAACIYGMTAMSESIRQEVGDDLCDGTTIVFADGFTAIVDPMNFRSSLPSIAAAVAPECHLTDVASYLYWAVIGRREVLGLDSASLPVRDDLDVQVRRIVASWHPSLQAIIGAAASADIAALPVRNARPWTPPTRSAVTLLGDAVHAMSPASGLGANTALQDAADLAQALVDSRQDGACLATAVGRYEVRMRPRAIDAVRASEEGSRRLFSRD